MMFPWGLDYVVTRIKYILDKIKYQFYYGISTKESITVQYYGKKENNYCIQVIKKTINTATYWAVLRSGFPPVKHQFPLRTIY